MTVGDLIGLDIGGTTLKAVRARADGTLVRKVTVAAGGRIPREALLSILAQTVTDLAGRDVMHRIGVAVGGLVQADGSMPRSATNLPNLAGVPLAPLFAACLPRPFTIVNDAQAAMHGEFWVGAARGLSDALLITFGTGIGAGLLLDGRVRQGPHGSAGEIGAVLLGAFEGIGIAFEDIAAPVRFERRQGRPLAEALLDAADPAGRAALDAIGRSLAAAHLLLDLQAIIIGGGIAERGEPLRAAIDGAVIRACPPDMHHGLKVYASTLGPYAGAIGAVAPTIAGAHA